MSSPSDNNQPIDLAQKSQASKISESVKCGTTTFVHFGSGQFITSNAPSTFTSNKSGTSSAKVSASSTSSTATAPSGYHIPKGAAVVANMTASRLQNLTTIIKTTSQVTPGSNSATISTPRASLIGQRMVPISANNWISRNSTTTVLTNKVPTTQVTGRATITTARPAQSPSMPVTTFHGAAGKPGAIVTGNVRSPGASGGVRIATGSEGLRPQAPKGLQISHSISHAGQKYIGNPGVGSIIRGVNSNALVSHGNIAGGTMYGPTSTLVTSLASSGTTITPHPGNRNQTPQSSLRISTTGVTSAFSQASNQSNAVGGISFTTPSGGNLLNPNLSSRSQPNDPIAIRPPVVRAQAQGIKGSTNTLPPGTQIAFSGPKVLTPPTQGGQPLAMTQLSNISVSKPGSINNQSATNVPFQSRMVTTVAGSNISRVGGSAAAISMTKVIPQGKISHNLGSVVGASSAVSPDGQPSHTSVFLHRTSQPATPVTTAVMVTHSDRNVATIPQYSLTAPYYLESQNQGTFPMNATIIPHTMSSTHFIPTTTASVARGNSAPSVSNSTDSSIHQGTLPIIKANSSPRPSILRKRADIDGSPLKAAKNLSAALNIPISSPPSPKRPDSGGNGNVSSGSTTLSASSSPGLHINEEDPNTSLKNDMISHQDFLEDGTANNSTLVGIPLNRDLSQLPSNKRDGKCYSQYSVVNQTPDGVSPRKKPRKQKLMGNELQESRLCDEEFEQPLHKKKKDNFHSQNASTLVDSDEDDGDLTASSDAHDTFKSESQEASPHSPEQPESRRPHMSLMNSYRQPWKSRHNHFSKHSDVRPKEEKKRTVNEIATQKLAMQRVNGWKVMHISGQVEDLVDMEGEVATRLRVLLRAIEKRQLQRKPYKDFDKDVDRISELVKANIQRSIIIKDQMADAKNQMSKIFDHKDNIVEILTKYSTKRSLRKKEKL